MTVRLYEPSPMADGAEMALSAGAAKHVQVLRAQPGDALVLFNGQGMQWPAQVLRMGRSEVSVRLGEGQVVQHGELAVHVTLALGMPANERMDTVVEKATELGVAAIQPLHCERSVLRLKGERAERKREHWQAVAAAACEQCGRATLPMVHPVADVAVHLAQPDAGALKLLLSPHASAVPLTQRLAGAKKVVLLSGPEGGLSPAEEDLAQRAGYLPTSLGPRVLRADTAPLAALAHIGLLLP